MWKPLAGGHMIGTQGLTMIWICGECK
jgi:hypothetical protein